MDIIGKSEHWNIVRKLTPSLCLLDHALGRVAIEEYGLEPLLKRVGVAIERQGLWAGDDGIVIAQTL